MTIPILGTPFIIGSKPKPKLLLSSVPENWSDFTDYYTVVNDIGGAYAGTPHNISSYGGFAGRTKAAQGSVTSVQYYKYLTPKSPVPLPSYDNGGGIDVYADYYSHYVNSGTLISLLISLAGGSVSFGMQLGNPQFFGCNNGHGETAITTWPQNTNNRCRVQMTGGKGRVKVWTSGTAEPESWNAETNFSNVPLGGGSSLSRVDLYMYNYGNYYCGGWTIWQIPEPIDDPLEWPISYDYGITP